MYISKSVLWGCGVALVLAIGAALWWAGVFESLTSALNLDVATEQESAEQQEQQMPPNELATGSDSSDEALEEDLDQLDAELESYSETSAELDSSLEDEQVEQEY